MQRLISLLVVTLCLSTVHAEELTLRHSAVIPAPVADVWDAFTTTEGIESWMVPKGEVDLRVGGSMRSTYVPDAELGGPHTITNTILSYEPQRMLSIQTTGCPENFPFKDAIKETWSVMHFEPIGENHTRLVITGYGYDSENEQSKAMHDYFTVANGQVLDALRNRFADNSPAVDQQRALELLGRLPGGEWIHESETPDGGTFRVRNVLEQGADGVSIVGHSWLGMNGEAMFDHGRTIVYREPGTISDSSDPGVLRIFNIDENGNVTNGTIELADGHTLLWRWNAKQLETGETIRYHVEQEFGQWAATNEYQMRLYEVHDDGSRHQHADLAFRRVEQAPSRFLTTASK